MATILVLDDSPTIRAALRVHLSVDKHVLHEAANADDGLQTCRTQPIQVVIADIGMPGKSGIEFVKELRADPNPALQALPVILLSAVMLRAEGMRAGANAFLSKPVDGAKLRETLSTVLASAR
jgi:CheY-like chemotaxis protein